MMLTLDEAKHAPLPALWLAGAASPPPCCAPGALSRCWAGSAQAWVRPCRTGCRAQGGEAWGSHCGQRVPDEGASIVLLGCWDPSCPPPPYPEAPPGPGVLSVLWLPMPRAVLEWGRQACGGAVQGTAGQTRDALTPPLPGPGSGAGGRGAPVRAPWIVGRQGHCSGLGPTRTGGLRGGSPPAGTGGIRRNLTAPRPREQVLRNRNLLTGPQPDPPSGTAGRGPRVTAVLSTAGVSERGFHLERSRKRVGFKPGAPGRRWRAPGRGPAASASPWLLPQPLPQPLP